MNPQPLQAGCQVRTCRDFDFALGGVVNVDDGAVPPRCERLQPFLHGFRVASCHARSQERSEALVLTESQLVAVEKALRFH